MTRFKLPKGSRMTGHDRDYDVYLTPKGKTYLYKGKKKGDWDKSESWEEA